MSSPQKTFAILLEAYGLPPIEEGERRHLVTPKYQRAETGKASIMAIDVTFGSRRP